jgi:hypothetical protein
VLAWLDSRINFERVPATGNPAAAFGLGRMRRLLRDLEDAASGVAERAHDGHTFPRAVRSVSSIRVDLVGVRGEGRTASAVRHVVGIFERSVRRPRGRPP